MKYIVDPQVGDFKSVEDAVNSLEEGDEILIREGNYLLKSTLKLKPRMKIKGEAGHKVILSCSDDSVILCDHADKVEIKNITITGGSSKRKVPAILIKGSIFTKIISCNINGCQFAGIYAEESMINLVNCKIQNNNGYGIYITKNSDFNISGNMFSDNANPAILLEDRSTGIISDNSIFQNKGNGVVFSNVTDITFEKNKISESGYTGLFVLKSININIRKNNINSNNGNGILVRDSENIFILSNKLWNHHNPAIWISASNVIAKDNDIYDIQDNAVVAEKSTKLVLIGNLFVRCGHATAPVIWCCKTCEINENVEEVNKFVETQGFFVYKDES